MNSNKKTPINHPENNELLGYVAQTGTGWQAQTIFGYAMELTSDEESATRIVSEQGLSYLMGVWQYFDKDDQQWYPCVINEANSLRVQVTRTTDMGFIDPENTKTVILTKPDETNLVKG